MKRFWLFLVVSVCTALCVQSCASSKHGKLKRGKAIPCPVKDC